MTDLDAAYALLDLEPGAPEDQIRQSYKLLVHLFAPASPVVYGLYTKDEARRLVERLEAAYALLTDPTRRAPRPGAPALTTPPAPTAMAVRDPLDALGFPADAPVRGETIKRVRHLLGVRLEDIADRTKIGVFTLRQIEADAYGDLPAKVYLKGFLRQMAPILRLDPDRLARDYLTAFDAWVRDNTRKRRW